MYLCIYTYSFRIDSHIDPAGGRFAGLWAGGCFGAAGAWQPADGGPGGRAYSYSSTHRGRSCSGS